MKESLPFLLSCKTTLTEPIEFALSELSKVKGREAIQHLILQEDQSLPQQGYRREVESGLVKLFASSSSGFLYGLLDLSDFDWTESKTVNPYIKKRGIKYNIPLDVRTPSYSDGSDMALHSRPQIWEFSFWKEYLDTMALNKYNVLSLWSLSPFPSLVRPKEFAATALDDVMGSSVFPSYTMSGHGLYTPDMYDRLYTIKEISFTEKVNFINAVLAYAKSRCIEVYLFTWNLFCYGTEHAPYQITDDMHNPITRTYIYRSVTALLETYPLLAGLGVTAGEHMSSDAQRDIPYLYETYAQAISDYLDAHPQRKFQFIHRTHWAASDSIKKYYSSYKHPFALSFKYSQAHLHTTVNPPFLKQFLAQSETEFPLFLTLRDDDYYLHRWANHQFVQTYVQNIPHERIEGFYLGSDGYPWGWETVSRHLRPQLYLQKMWLKTALFGKLAYNPDLPRETFEQLFYERYSQLDRTFFSYFEEASSLLNLVTTLKFRDWDFQWCPELCCQFVHPPIAKLQFVDILDFLESSSMSESGFRSIRETCLHKSRDYEVHDAISVYSSLYEKTKRILTYVEPMLEKLETRDEIWELVGDVYSLALLGSYYAHKIESAYLLGKAVLAKDKESKGIELHLTKAVQIWRDYSQSLTHRYKPQRFARLCSYIDPVMFIQSAEHDLHLAKETVRKAERGEYGLVP